VSQGVLGNTSKDPCAQYGRVCTHAVRSAVLTCTMVGLPTICHGWTSRHMRIVLDEGEAKAEGQ